MTLTHRPFEQLGSKTEVPRSPPEPAAEGEPRCRLCHRLWSEKPGKSYCMAQHGSCGLCKAPRIRCRCLAPVHWTGTRVPAKPFAAPAEAPSQTQPSADISGASNAASVTKLADTAYPEETTMEESPVSDAPSPKIEFVLQHPESLPAKEVVQLAEQAGITVSQQHVYQIRSDARLNKKGHGRPSKPAYVPRGRPPSIQSAFVRTLAFDAPIKDVIKAARAAGIKGVDERYIKTLRGRDGREGRKKDYGKPMAANAVATRNGRSRKSPKSPKSPAPSTAIAIAAEAPRPEPVQRKRQAPEIPAAGLLTDAEIEFMQRAQAIGMQRAIVLMQHAQALIAAAFRDLKGG